MHRTTIISLALFGLILALFFGLKYSDKLESAKGTPAPDLSRVFPLDLTTLRNIEIQTPGGSIKATGSGNSWILLEPSENHSDIAPELINEILDLAILRKLDISDNEIGLTIPPRLEITLTGLDDQIFSISIGIDTPTGTGTYARSSDGGVVMLRTAAVQAIEALILQVNQP